MCTCCICTEPTFFVLPETVEVYNLEAVEDSNSIVTIFNNDLVPGLFSAQDLSIRCQKSEVTPARKVNKNIEYRKMIPSQIRSGI